jgi:uncharacterized protein
MRRFALTAIAAAAVLAGCSKAAPPPPPARLAPVLPTKAQGKLRTMRLWLGPEELKTELALTELECETGMMFRTNLDENAGMLFVFGSPWRASFWMKNCPLPLSCAYMDSSGTIVEIHDLQAQDTNNVVAASNNILYVLEVNQGWFKRHHIEPGTVVRSEVGSLPETFSRRR